jgi:hypothetical protein
MNTEMNAVIAQAKAVADNVQAAPTEVPNILLLESLEHKCKQLEGAIRRG